MCHESLSHSTDRTTQSTYMINWKDTRLPFTGQIQTNQIDIYQTNGDIDMSSLSVPISKLQVIDKWM